MVTGIHIILYTVINPGVPLAVAKQTTARHRDIMYEMRENPLLITYIHYTDKSYYRKDDTIDRQYKIERQ